MLDLACIFTTGGVILFWKVFCELGVEVVNEFIFNVLVQEKMNQKEWRIKNRVFIWKYDPTIKVVFLFAYQELFKSLDFDKLLNYTKSFYKKNLWPQVTKNGDLIMHVPEFDVTFDKILKEYKRMNQDIKRQPDMKADSSNQHHHADDDGDSAEQGNGEEPGKSKDKDKAVEENPDRDGSSPAPILKTSTRTNLSNPEISPQQSKRVAFKEDDAKPKELISHSNTNPSPIATGRKLTPKEIMEANIRKKQEDKLRKKEGATGGAKSPVKQDRVWGDSTKVTSKDMEKLDYSKKFSKSGTMDGSEGQSQQRSSYFDDEEEFVLDFDIVSDDESNTGGKNVKKSSILSSLKNSIKSFAIGKNLTEEDLKPILEKFRDDLMGKNVAEEIARGITESLKVKLLSHKLQAFSSITELVKLSLKETLTKILTPKKSYDILSEAMKSRERGEPYVISFIGVNGVGKSTNLAKIAYLYKSQGFSVMFAACDNFRAGAIEQLKTHGRNLDIPVYDRGYKDEPHRIAKEAIREARSKRIDVVLIDTAGRMQNNEPLMRALAKLVTVNNPDLVVFIGEALVGNDGVDQLTNFNNALVKYSTEEKDRREINAILISKFDTVDEKGRYSCYHSWSSNFDDLCNWKAYIVFRNWPEIPKFEKSRCRSGSENASILNSLCHKMILLCLVCH